MQDTFCDNDTMVETAKRYQCKHCGEPIYMNEDFVKFSLNYADEITGTGADEVADVGFHVECFRDMAGDEYFLQLKTKMKRLCGKCGRKVAANDSRCNTCPRPGHECVEVDCNKTRLPAGFYCQAHTNGGSWRRKTP